METSVGLSTSSPNVTKDHSINVVVEFTKPVFGFEASMVNVVGGRITRQVHILTLETADIVTCLLPKVISKFSNFPFAGLGNFQELCTP